MAQEYFSDLNYTLANEDTRIEHDLLSTGADRVFCIAGSGSRVIPLMAKNPKVIEVVDMSESQLYLTELRWRAAQAMSYEEWLYFMGYRGALQSSVSVNDNDRIFLFEKVKLSEPCRQYWLDRRDGWKNKGFILLGRWESHFQILGRIFREGLRCDFTPIFEAQSLPEQIELWEKNWPSLRFRNFLRIAASEYVFNKFLYKGHFAGNDAHRTEQRAPWQFIDEEFKRLFHTQLVRKSYFMQILLLGKIRFEEGLPFEAHQNVFEAIRRSSTELVFHKANLLDVLPMQPWSFVSLSDTVSYLQHEAANQLLQRLHPETPKSAIVAIRSFMRAPTDLDERGWDRLHDKEKSAWSEDVTGVYQFHLYRKNG